MKTVLSIAGSDPSGGAGIQADLKTFQRFGVYGMAAISLLTVQNTMGVKEVLVIHPDKIKAQILTVLEDIRPDAVKLGALGHGPAVIGVAEALKGYDGPIVADPVMLSKNGALLLIPEALEVYKQRIIPISFLVTPNLDEAAKLSGLVVTTLSEMEKAALVIQGMGAKNVLVKGGHLEGDKAQDLFFDGSKTEIFFDKRIVSQSTHGVGCSLSSAIASGLALGRPLNEAIREAKNFISHAIANAPKLGFGCGPVCI